ncbi:hypothetical protein CABS01_15243 [Colletotrichum abscissum]|uniref:Uncharacterized protein n=1 Tax=Colletotrichum abscissum TaxID=1671311 RepID=A0A9Q0BAV3_9PEZI|nr:uncharacterized protein CABS01_15243 [Colletotrichum abscissum]KAI3559517.1 hypothetical protein CABS02_00492 [Colletotrichum abscissum]KAK1476708.1 hypothetical protein CABS01_15243 [Colletotrichum abscissum]
MEDMDSASDLVRAPPLRGGTHPAYFLTSDSGSESPVSRPVHGICTHHVLYRGRYVSRHWTPRLLSIGQYRSLKLGRFRGPAVPTITGSSRQQHDQTWAKGELDKQRDFVGISRPVVEPLRLLGAILKPFELYRRDALQPNWNHKYPTAV